MLGVGYGIASPALWAARWSPSRLFGTTLKGLMLSAARRDTLYQDSAGTIPVTASGQPVGMVRDLSGRGNHAVQSISQRRPTWNFDGAGRPKFALDGLDDNLNALNVPWGGSDEVTIVIAVSAVATGIQSGLIRGGNASPTRFGIIKLSDDRIQAISSGTAVATVTSPSAVTGTPAVYSVQAKIGAPNLILRHNGVQVAASVVSQGTGTYIDHDINIGSWGGFQLFMGDTPAVFAINKWLSPADLAATEAWAARHNGALLA